jgi:hypothetical protein
MAELRPGATGTAVVRSLQGTSRFTSLVVRRFPTGTARIGTIARDVPVLVTGRVGSRYKVDHDGQTGYVTRSGVSFRVTPPIMAGSPTPGITGAVPSGP